MAESLPPGHDKESGNQKVSENHATGRASVFWLLLPATCHHLVDPGLRHSFWFAVVAMS